MKNRELGELLKYSSPYSILVVTWRNKLIELKTPFQVQLIQDIGELKKDELAIVSLVKLATNMKTVFIIENKAYFYYYFKIVLGE